MNRKILLMISGVLLSACASQSPDRGANSDSYGFSGEAIEAGRYRVTFRARGDDMARAVDHTMLRASEVAMANAYDWLAVISHETRVDNASIGPEALFGPGSDREAMDACGLLGCRSYTRPLQRYQSGMVLGDPRSEVEVSLTVRMGTGIRPTEVESFDAREIYALLAHR